MFRVLVAHHKPKSVKYSFPTALVVKNLLANAGDTRDLGSIPGLGRSPGGWQPTPVFLPGESHGQRSLAAKVHTVEKSRT